MKRLLWMGCLAYLLTGFTHVILGAVLPELLEHYGRSYSDGGKLVFLEFAGFLIGVLAMPRLSVLLSRRTSLICASALLGLSEIGLTLLPPWGIALVLAAGAGFGFGLIESGIGTFILTAAKEKQAVAMSRLEVFFGLGALLMPFISSFLILRGLWSYSFLVLGLSAWLMTFGWIRLSFGELDELLRYRKARSGEGPAETEGGTAAHSASYGRNGLLLLGLFVLLFFLYVGTEVSIVNYLPSIFVEKLQASESLASLSVTAFWLTMVIGRLYAGALAEKITYYRYLLWSSIGLLLLLFLLAVTGGKTAAFSLVLLVGLLMSGMFAVALIFANRLLPQAMTERTTSLLIASGGLGGSLLPLLVGRLMDIFSAQAALWFLAGAVLLMLALIVISASGQSE
jgi:FHS family glucose/mannose:H+ symporter-like MFS transporter